MLVRRVRRPVAGRGQHLAGDQGVGVEGVGGAEVVDLAARRAGAAQLDRHAVGALVPEGQPALADRGRQGEPAAARAGDLQPGVARGVDEVAGSAEDVAADPAR